RQSHAERHEQQYVRAELDAIVGQDREDPGDEPQKPPGAGVDRLRPESDERQGDAVDGDPRRHPPPQTRARTTRVGPRGHSARCCLTTDASDSAWAWAVSASAASTITRTSGSVPDLRSSTRPVEPSWDSTSLTASCTPA